MAVTKVSCKIAQSVFTKKVHLASAFQGMNSWICLDLNSFTPSLVEIPPCYKYIRCYMSDNHNGITEFVEDKNFKVCLSVKDEYVVKTNLPITENKKKEKVFDAKYMGLYLKAFEVFNSLNLSNEDNFKYAPNLFDSRLLVQLDEKGVPCVDKEAISAIEWAGCKVLEKFSDKLSTKNYSIAGDKTTLSETSQNIICNAYYDSFEKTISQIETKAQNLAEKKTDVEAEIVEKFLSRKKKDEDLTTTETNQEKIM